MHVFIPFSAWLQKTSAIHTTSVFSWPTLQVWVVAWLVSVACWCLLLVVGYINIFVCWLLTVDCSFVIVRLWLFEFNLLLFGVWWCWIYFWFMSDGLVIFVAWWLFHCPTQWVSLPSSSPHHVQGRGPRQWGLRKQSGTPRLLVR